MLRSSVQFCALLVGVAVSNLAAETRPVSLEIELQTLLEREDPGSSSLWFHPRVALVPTEPPTAVMTLQKLLGKSDYFSGLSVMTSSDSGRNWTPPAAPKELAWVAEDSDDEVSIAVADVTPGYHAGSGTVLAVGAQVRYSKDGKQLADKYRSHQTAYSVRDADGNWLSWQQLKLPENTVFDFARSACAQWLEEADGNVLLPFYVATDKSQPFSTTVVRCAFDGKTLHYIEHGNFLKLETMRGLYEPSLVHHRGRYFVTMRNDHAAYVSISEDGLNFSDPKKWRFDDGEELGSYNTQAHWLEAGGALFLTYTRKGANNDHVIRHRAPIFVAQVDPEKLVVIRDTEQIVVPERGATLGNFGVVKISDTESWVTVGEGNVNGEAKKRGANGSVFLARVRVAEETQVASSSEKVKFSVMGCGPYTPTAAKALVKYIGLENRAATSEFMVHVGDIVTGKAKHWKEDQFIKVADILKNQNRIPTFVVPGDNEWTDHAEPDQAWAWWGKHFMRFEQNWGTSPLGVIERQEKRPENFAFTHKDILFIGINKVGGKVYDKDQVKGILKDDGEWITKHLADKTKSRAAVIFAQASAGGPLPDLVQVLAPAARAYQKPILYVHADIHNWVVEENAWAANITRLQLETIDEVFPPVQITVDDGPDPEFHLDRRLDDETWKVSTVDGHGIHWSIRGGGEGNDKIRGMSAARDGGVFVTGEISGESDFGGHRLVSNGELDCFVAKLDAGGRVLWARSAGGAGIDRGYSVAALPKGGCVVTGHFESEHLKFDSAEVKNEGDYDGFVAMFDAKGNCQWVKRFGGSGYDYGHGIAVLKHGDIVLSGAIAGKGTVGDVSLGSEKKRSALLARLSWSGEWEWAKGIEASSISGHDVAVSSDYQIYLSGYSRGTVKWSGKVTTESKLQDIFVARFNGKGEFKWVRNAGGKSDGLATSVAVDDATGNVGIVGMFKGETTFGSRTFTSRGGHDFFAAVLDREGGPVGAFHGSGEGTDYGLGIAAGENGFVATGEFSGEAEFAGQALSGAGEREVWVARIPADGSDINSVEVLGGSDHDLSYAIAGSSNGSAVIAGAFRNQSEMGETSLQSVGGNDLFVTKLQLEKESAKSGE